MKEVLMGALLGAFFCFSLLTLNKLNSIDNTLKVMAAMEVKSE